MKKKIYTLLLLSVMISGYSQTTNEDNKALKVFPSSPDAYSLGTYGNINIGEYTGTMMQDIPLYSYAVGDIKVPVSLKYSSNGVKVDDYTTVAGLGWTLSANGVISRIARDKEDDLDGATWQNDGTVDPATGYKGIQLNFFEHVALTENYDTEKDLYRLNIPEIFSISFVQHGANTWIQDKKSDFKIQKITGGFLITSPQGIKYYFTLIESSESRVQGTTFSPPELIDESAYFLTRIEDTKNNIVYFEYEPEEYLYTANNNDMYNFFENTYSINCQGSPLPLAGIAGMRQSSTVVRYNSHRLKKIRNNIDQHVLVFNYGGMGSISTNRASYLKEIKSQIEGGTTPRVIENYKLDYLATPNERVFLTKIASEISNKQHTFEYLTPELLPKRLSNAQDFWGYYNGAITNSHLIGKVDSPALENSNFSFANRELNTSLSPSGLLSKITYPTKGYSKIFYEPHTEWGTKFIPATIKSKTMHVLTDDDTWDATTIENFHSGKSQRIKFAGGAQFNEDCTSSMTHQVRVNISVKNLTTGQNMTLSRLTSNGYIAETNPYYYPGGPDAFYLNADSSSDYQVTIKVLRNCFGGGVHFEYFDAPDVTLETNLTLGGNRVERIEHYDNVSTSPQTEKWYYAHKNQLNRSSGISPFKTPVLWKYTDGVHYCPPPDLNPMFYKYTPYKYVSIFSNSLIPLFGNESQNVGYEYVTKSFGGSNFERGGKFTTYQAGNDPIASNIFGNGNYRGGNFTNSSWNKGFVKNTEDLMLKNGTLSALKEVTNEYYYNTSKKEEFLNFTGIKYGNFQMIAKMTYKCTAADVTRQNTGYNPCFGQPIDEPVPYLSSLDLSMFGEVLQYKFISHDYYLSKVTTKENFDNGTAKTTVEYLNSNPNHYQTTSQKTILPDLSINETLYSYAHEKNNQLMIGKNMVGIPLEVKTQKTTGTNTKLLSRTEINYPISLPNPISGGLVLPLSEYYYDTLSSATSYKNVSFDKYDEKGNILQYTTKEGTPVAVIWGYNKTKPIAKIEGAKFSDITQSKIDAIVNASDADAAAGPNNDESGLLAALDVFRKTAFPSTQVTTYTYDPLIGVRTVTSPSGVQEQYVYDSKNRLKEIKQVIKDASGTVSSKVVKEYQYNYKN